MAKAKGTPKTGGRKAGVPNKRTAELKTWVGALIEKNMSKMEKDLKKLDPKDRLTILEKLMQYTIPKQQSISVEAQIQAEYRELEILMGKLPDEAVNKITERLIKLNQLSKSYE